ncbi:ABC transporter ATP-binding protein [Anaeropeptidivorans aminofermentans]|jgi:putative ABC transport system ATP-binding protein|uniref:ABC transporter ATP-binding protein n=1 Tax=Anaeropeptidivorans aminofermentans TaxID=2934315 RepID=UPI002024991F|nr:ABC transporter ATP-binding protein [Anaeropeptidivorans aminofermentans]MBE6013381.1 ABC transporter ATP-binding protein [Lachnospiraceae bacterium]
MEPLIQIQGVTKDYKMGEVSVNALRGIDLEIYEGEFLVILGASGSGKSTLLNIIGGIDTPTKGKIIFNGQDIGEYKDRELTNYRKNAIGFVFQFYNLVPNLTAKENIELSCELSKSPINVDELLENIGLLEWSGHFPSQMSGGQQQRVAIARALGKNPAVLLCDEPTGALDFTTGIQVLKILKEFNENYKKTIIIITHNAGIGQMADRIVYIKDGLVDKIENIEKPIRPEEVYW